MGMDFSMSDADAALGLYDPLQQDGADVDSGGVIMGVNTPSLGGSGL
jgi:hypothetical protein